MENINLSYSILDILKDINDGYLTLLNEFPDSLESELFKFECGKKFIYVLKRLNETDSQIQDRISFKGLSLVHGDLTRNTKVINRCLNCIAGLRSNDFNYNTLSCFQSAINEIAPKLNAENMLSLRLATYLLEERCVEGSSLIPKYWDKGYNGLVEAEKQNDCEDINCKIYNVTTMIRDMIYPTNITRLKEDTQKLKNILNLLTSFINYVEELRDL